MKHPKLGQHFLNDTEIINLIIDQAKLLKSKNIIEFIECNFEILSEMVFFRIILFDVVVFLFFLERILK